MNKLFFQISVLVVALMLTFANIKATDSPVFTTADSTNVVLEECTGTWCQYCPCGHTNINTILQYYPKTVVICYHGPPNYGTPADPWTAAGYPMIQLFGMGSYPTAVINRTSGIIQRNAWFSYVSSYVTLPPAVRIELTNAHINNSTRLITGTVTATALQDLTGAYNIFIAITENNLIYGQTGNSGCPGATSYTHNYVARAIATPNTGTQLTPGPWNINAIQTYNINYTVPTGIDLANCTVNIFVFQDGTPLTTGAPIQNGLATPTSAFTPTGVEHFETIASDYNLAQNYPNPFNPTTNIRFTIPKDGNTSFKIYDMSGNEVAAFVNGFMKAGIYNVVFEGSNLASGVYFYKLTSGNFSETKRMVLVK